MATFEQKFLELAIRRLKNKKRLPRQHGPKAPEGIEREYKIDLRNYFRRVEHHVNGILIPRLPDLLASHVSKRSDAAGDDAHELVKRVKIKVEEDYSDAALKRLAMHRGVETSAFNRKVIGSNIKKVIGIEPIFSDVFLAGELSTFAIGNVNLITSLKDGTLDNVEKKVFTAFRQGTRAEDLALDIRKYIDPDVGNVGARADLIARDQIAKLNGQLTYLRQTDLGINRYTWRTMGDERVRDSHAVKDGNIYSWDDPPADTGHPGEDFQCRCYAEPVLSDLFD